MAEMLPSILDALGQGLEAAGNSIMWGGGAGNPQVLQGQYNLMLQENARRDDRKAQLAHFIMQAVQIGDVPWDQAQNALQRLGYDTRGMGNLFQTDQGAGLGEVYNALARGDRPDLSVSPAIQGLVPTEGPGIRPSALVPQAGVPVAPGQPGGQQGGVPGVGEPATTVPFGEYAQNLPPGQPIDETGKPTGGPAILGEKKDSAGNIVRQVLDPSDGRVSTVKVSPSGEISATGGVDDTVISAMTPEERQFNSEARSYLATPKRTVEEIMLLGKRAKLNRRDMAILAKEAPQIASNDEQKRQAMLKQMQANEELARKRINAAEYKQRERPLGKTDKNGQPMFQMEESLDGGRTWRNVGEPSSKGSGQTINMYERTVDKLSAEAVFGEKPMERYQAALTQLDTLDRMEDLNKKGVMGGFGAGTKVWLANALAPLATQDQLKTLANSVEYMKDASGLVLQLLQTKALGSGNSITNTDRDFIAKIVPALEYDIHARQQLIQMMKHYAQYEVDYYKSKKQWANKHGDLGEWEPPTFRPYAETEKGSTPDYSKYFFKDQ